jgi:4-hydroxy-tetrahydrodipicolinate synthase
MPTFGHLFTAMVTALTPDLEVDYDRSAELARRLVKAGSDGLVVTGTTGEAPTLSAAEKTELHRVIKAAVGPQVSVLAGTGSYDTAETVKLSRAAEQAGVDGLLLIAPYYNKPSQEGIYQHFRRVAEAVSIPIILYNHPPRTGVTIEAGTLARLAEVPGIAGIKDSSASLDLVSEYRRRTPPGFLLYSGNDSLTLPILAVGGHGVISVASHIGGPVLARMMAHFRAGRVGEACQDHYRLFDLFNVLFCAPSPAPTKAALAMCGFPVGEVRPPLLPLAAADRARVQEVLNALPLPAEV